MNKTKTICIQICAENEWEFAAEILHKYNAEFSRSPFGYYSKTTINQYICIFYHSGASKTLSAAACQFAITNWQPDIVFVLGTAGGIADGINVNDIVIARETLQYDCISRMGSESELFYKEFITMIDNSWIDFDNLPFKYIEGIIATADQDADVRIREILKPHNVIAADWESGAIAPICKLNSIPCCIIRGVSDVPEYKPDETSNQYNDFLNNTGPIMQNLINKVLPVLISMWKK